ncbi:MAG: hypothetical protein HYR73_02535 [Candidatus Eisenbacteria bacterium]|nr:hypothetical protein [Candidatus Eisenbacteria bacterium]
MKRLIFLILVAAAAWYGWHHYGELLNRMPSNVAVIVNSTGHEMTRVRLTAAGQGILVKESIPENGREQVKFKVDQDASFTLVWQYADKIGEQRWTGGTVTHGPVVQKCTFTVDTENQVIFLPENLTSGG